MKKLNIFVLSFVFGSCLALFANAKVVFLPSHDSSIGLGGVNNITCQESGYTYSRANCLGGLYDACPSNSSYYKGCCPEGYNYTPQQCTEQGKQPSTDNCEGFHKCI
ncbi:MAG: hypothetical protein J6W11_02105 [Alphaproteobacteria bacterium]|nr:hypothetical protein [Alphaproteobacteria bacterium]